MRGSVLTLVLAMTAVTMSASPAVARSAEGASVSVDRSSIDRKLGQELSFTTAVQANGGQRHLIAHLNILSLDGSVYVDPEDWSSARTRYLTVPASGTVDVAWTLKAVSSGSFIVYVGVLGADGSGPIGVSPPVRVDVAERRTLDAGGAAYLVIAIPSALGALAVGRGIALRRRRGARI